MPLSIEKLRILTFPQRIAGRPLDLHVLLLPTQRLLNVLVAFPSQLIRAPRWSCRRSSGDSLLEMDAISGLASYPFSNPALLAATAPRCSRCRPTPRSRRTCPRCMKGCARSSSSYQASAKTRRARRRRWPMRTASASTCRESYRTAFNFTTPRTEFAKTDDSYHCAIRRSSEKNDAFKQSKDEITWGRVVAFCLRQPLLAERIGLLHRLDGDAAVRRLLQGGRVGLLPSHVRRSPTSTSSTPAPSFSSYAARIPPIDEPRQLFAAMQFPVVAGPAQPERRLRHAQDRGLRLRRWVREDRARDAAGQLEPPERRARRPAPSEGHRRPPRLGRRADSDLAEPAAARRPGDAGQAHRRAAGRVLLPRRRSRGRRSRLALARPHPEQGGADAGGDRRSRAAQTELETGVQVFPSKVNGAIDTAYWLPSYFTQWYGAVARPPRRSRRGSSTPPARSPSPARISDANIKAKPTQKGDLYEPCSPTDCELKYGHEYEFRVRLGDLTGGGPLEDDDELNDAPATSASLVFQRYVAPKRLTVTPDDPQDDEDAGSVQFLQGTLVHRRPTASRDIPRSSSPSSTPTTRSRSCWTTRLSASAKPAGQTIKEYRDVSYFDPDVDRMLVVVDVKTLLLDNQASASEREPFIRLYSTLRFVRRRPRGRRSPCSSSTATRTSSTSERDRSRRSAALAGRHRRRRRHRAAEVARHPHHDLPGVLRTSQASRHTSASPRRGSTRRSIASASRSSSSCARTRMTRSTSSSRDWNRTSCRACTCSPIRRR